MEPIVEANVRPATEKLTETTFDVVVVGGGLAGLTAAFRMLNLGKKVLVCDAYDVGGRTRSKAGTSVGGTWGMYEDDDLLGLGLEVGCMPFIPQLALDGVVMGHIVAHPFMLLKLWFLGRKALKLMENHEHISNEELVKMDNMSLEKWLKAEQGFLDDDKARTAVRLFFGAQEGFDWDMDFSALQAALMVHSRLRTFNRTGKLFPEACRWEGGTGVFVQAVKKAIIAKGGVVLENAPVTQIHYHTPLEKSKKNLVAKVTFKDGQVAAGSYVVMAISQHHCQNIKFEPELPEPYTLLMKAQRTQNGAGFNPVFYFKSPIIWSPGYGRRRMLWASPEDRNEGPKPSLLPKAIVVEKKETEPVPRPAFTINTVMDQTETTSEKSFIRCQIEPARVVGMTDEEITEAVLCYLIDHYPQLRWREEYLGHTNFTFMDYTEHFHVAYVWAPDGTLSKNYKYLNKPHKEIYWCGTERSFEQGLGWMEGAVHSGNLVAQQIAHADGMGHKAKEYFESVRLDKELALQKMRENSPSIGEEFWTAVGLIGSITGITGSSGIRTAQLTHNEDVILKKVKKC